MADNILISSCENSSRITSALLVNSGNTIASADRIEERFPEFFRTDYSKFVDFVRTYYRYFQSQSSSNLIASVRDIDRTSDVYLELLRREFSTDSRLYSFLSDKEFIRKSKEIFSSKGTEDSIKFLFTALYGQDVEIDTPADYIFKPSAASWYQEYSIKVGLLSGSTSAESLIGKIIYIRNKAGVEQPIEISNVIDLTDKISQSEYSLYYELFFLTEITIDTQLGNLVFDGNGFNSKIIPSLSYISIITAGSNFKVGQIIDLTSNAGSGAIGMISKVTPTGGIKNIKILKFGTDYQSNFFIGVVPDGAFTDQGTSFEATGAASINIALEDNQEEYKEYGSVLVSTYCTDQYAEYGYEGVFMSSFDINQSYYKEEVYPSLLLCSTGTICKYPGYFLSSVGMPSNESKIQDSNIYQSFSYVVKSEVDINEFRGVLESTVHPAGFKLYSDKLLSNDINMSPSIISSDQSSDNNYAPGILKSKIEFKVRATVGEGTTLKHFKSNINMVIDMKNLLDLSVVPYEYSYLPLNLSWYQL